MSWSSELTHLETIIRSAVGTIPSGSVGVTRGTQAGMELPSSALPHLMLFDPSETSSALDFLQEEITASYHAELWADADQSTMITYRDAIAAAVAANPTISGAVRVLRLQRAALFEGVALDGRRVLALEFQTVREVG